LVKIDTTAARVDIYAQQDSLAPQRMIPIAAILTTISNTLSGWKDSHSVVGIPCLKCGGFVSAQAATNEMKASGKTVTCGSFHSNEVSKLLEDDSTVKHGNQFVQFSNIRLGKSLGQGNFGKVYEGLIIF
jgi:hypothetical protein